MIEVENKIDEDRTEVEESKEEHTDDNGTEWVETETHYTYKESRSWYKALYDGACIGASEDVDSVQNLSAGEVAQGAGLGVLLSKIPHLGVALSAATAVSNVGTVADAFMSEGVDAGLEASGKLTYAVVRTVASGKICKVTLNKVTNVTKKKQEEKKVTDGSGEGGSGTGGGGSSATGGGGAGRGGNPKSRLPRTGGKWDGESGESNWWPDSPEAKKATGGLSIPFRGGRPDFSRWSKKRLEFKPGELDGTDKDFDKVYEKMMKEYNLRSKNAALEFLKAIKWTPHHHSKTEIDLVPTVINKIPHIGSASDLRGGF